MKFFTALLGEKSTDRIQKALEVSIVSLGDKVMSLLEPAVTVVAGDFTMTGENVVEYAGSGGHTIRIPSAAQIPGRRSRARVVLNNGKGPITLAAQGGQLVNGAASVFLGAGAAAVLSANGELKTTAYGPDAADFNSYCHKPGNSGLTHYNIAGAVGGNTLGAYAAMTGNANQLFALAFIAPRRGGTLSSLAYDSNNALGVSRIGVYANRADDDLYPGALLVDGGSIANTAAIKVATVSAPLVPGALYWAVYVTDDATASIRKLDTTTTTGMLGVPFAGSASTYQGLRVAFALAALPATFPAGGGHIQTVTFPVPALAYQVS